MTPLNVTQKDFIEKINVIDVKKRYKPEKYYVYCIKLYWSNQSKNFIYRRYSEFFDVQCQLLDKFKSESGDLNPTERILPFLPGKKVFGRSNTKAVALERLPQINEYCKKLISLKNDISRSDLVLSFFAVNEEDVAMHTDETLWAKNESEQAKNLTNISNPTKAQEYKVDRTYKAKSRSEVSVRKDTYVTAIEKSLSGWWLINTSNGDQGYVPYNVLEIKDNLDMIKLEKAEVYVVSDEYAAKNSDELTIKRGDFIEVIAKSLTGFWKVKLFNETEGLVPAVCLKKVIQNHETLITLKNSMQYKNTVQTKSDHSFDRAPPASNEDHSDESSCAASSKADTESNLNVSQVEPVLRAPTLSTYVSSNEVLCQASEKYDDPTDKSLSFDKGQKFQILTKENSDGWWFVKNMDSQSEGWVHSQYLISESSPIRVSGRPQSLDSVQLEFNEIFEKTFPKQAEKLNKIDENSLESQKLEKEIVEDIMKKKSFIKAEPKPKFNAANTRDDAS